MSDNSLVTVWVYQRYSGAHLHGQQKRRKVTYFRAKTANWLGDNSSWDNGYERTEPLRSSFTGIFSK